MDKYEKENNTEPGRLDQGRVPCSVKSGIPVEAIARELKVSKGSFYWHFKDVAALKTAMLAHWTHVGTRVIIANLDATNAPPNKQLKLIIELSSGNGTMEYGGLRTEGAIRNWARVDKDAAKALAKVEKTRLQFVAQSFQSAGDSTASSIVKARLLYAGLIGIEHLSIQGLADMQSDMLRLLDLLISESRLP